MICVVSQALGAPPLLMLSLIEVAQRRMVLFGATPQALQRSASSRHPQ